MEQMPIYLIFLQSFPETLILIYLGLTLTGVKLSDRQVILIALTGACLSYFIRGLILPPGTNVFIQLPVIVILLLIIGKVPLGLALVSIILGFLGVSFAEMLFIPLVADITGISIQQALAAPLWRILFPLPEFAFLTLLIIYLRRKDIHIFNVPDSNPADIASYT